MELVNILTELTYEKGIANIIIDYKFEIEFYERKQIIFEKVKDNICDIGLYEFRSRYVYSHIINNENISRCQSKRWCG